jgi:hypothetical protein
MALRDNNPNDGKIHAARLRPKGSKIKASPVVVSRRNKVRKGSGVAPAIILQEVSAMSRSKFYNENRNPSHSSGLSCFESQNR